MRKLITALMLCLVLLILAAGCTQSPTAPAPILEGLYELEDLPEPLVNPADGVVTEIFRVTLDIRVGGGFSLDTHRRHSTLGGQPLGDNLQSIVGRWSRSGQTLTLSSEGEQDQSAQIGPNTITMSVGGGEVWLFRKG